MDPESRSKAIQALRLGNKDALAQAIDALDDPDPITQEWATVALRSWKGDPIPVREALLDFFQKYDREALRCYAIESLGRLGSHLPLEWLPGLISQYQETPKPRVLGWAFHWIGRTAKGEESMAAFLDIGRVEIQHSLSRARFWKRFRLAVLRFAKRELRATNPETRMEKEWFRAHGASWILDDLGETAIEAAIKEQMLRDSQRALLPPEDLEEALSGEPLIPGRPLADSHKEQFVQDIADTKNARVVERVVYFRDQAKAQEAKRLAGFACQVCGKGMTDLADKSRFVHAHHAKPLGEGGKDEIENLVVLCPNCHSNAHSRSSKLVLISGRWKFVSIGGNQAVSPTTNLKGPEESTGPMTSPEIPSAPPGRPAEATEHPNSPLEEAIALLPLMPPFWRQELRRALEALAAQADHESAPGPWVGPPTFPAEVRAARGAYLLELFRNSGKPEDEQRRLAAEWKLKLGLGPTHEFE